MQSSMKDMLRGAGFLQTGYYVETIVTFCCVAVAAAVIRCFLVPLLGIPERQQRQQQETDDDDRPPSENNDASSSEGTSSANCSSANCEQRAGGAPAINLVEKTVVADQTDVPLPLSVNYHFTRKCNYTCGFCFHTAITSFLLPMNKAKDGLTMLRKAGMQKVNFSGGEPFLIKKGEYVGELVQFCKQDLGMESVSIVSNGSLIKEQWFVKYGEYLDILAISCDSFNEETNQKIGRSQGSRSNHIESLIRVGDWCYKYKVAFKINSVINTYNKDEDMNEEIQKLNPCRWKVFQCLIINGENAGEKALRNAEPFVITTEQFNEFLERHKNIKCLVPESNEAMRRSYIILDEYMRFLDGGTKVPSKSILDVGVTDALMMANFDEKMFFKRGGKYTWSKADMNLEW